MKANSILLVWMFLGVQFVYGQVLRTELYGRVDVDSDFVSGVNIRNISTDKVTTTDSLGNFSFSVKEGDVLFFSDIRLQTIELQITKQYLIEGFILMKMVQKENQLKEVFVLKKSSINAVSMGIVSENQKTYTPAERKLRTAGDFKPIMLLGLIGGSMPLDPLINKINGRTKRLKKEVVLEKKELNLKYLGVLFEQEYFVNFLKIPAEYVEGFKYFVVEDKKFTLVLESKNKVTTEFLLGELAVKYTEIIACENE